MYRIFLKFYDVVTNHYLRALFLHFRTAIYHRKIVLAACVSIYILVIPRIYLNAFISLLKRGHRPFSSPLLLPLLLQIPNQDPNALIILDTEHSFCCHSPDLSVVFVSVSTVFNVDGTYRRPRTVQGQRSTFRNTVKTRLTMHIREIHDANIMFITDTKNERKGKQHYRYESLNNGDTS